MTDYLKECKSLIKQAKVMAKKVKNDRNRSNFEERIRILELGLNATEVQGGSVGLNTRNMLLNLIDSISKQKK